jgi:hypothetical protein
LIAFTFKLVLHVFFPPARRIGTTQLLLTERHQLVSCRCFHHTAGVSSAMERSEQLTVGTG